MNEVDQHIDVLGITGGTKVRKSNCVCELGYIDKDKIDSNAKYLTKKLEKINGIGRCELRDDYNYVFDYDSQIFGIPLPVFVKAMNAEGIPCADTITVIPETFEPFPVNIAGVCLSKEVLSGMRCDIDDVIEAIKKISENTEELMYVYNARYHAM